MSIHRGERRCAGLIGGQPCWTPVYGEQSRFCDSCQILRNQHAVSHDWEGHTDSIVPMCVLCERLAGIGAK